MRETFAPCVYILASRRHGTLYIGVTSNLLARVVQHREGLIPGFTRRYGIKRLVHFETYDTMEAAITREAAQGLAPHVEDRTGRGEERALGPSRRGIGPAAVDGPGGAMM